MTNLEIFIPRERLTKARANRAAGMLRAGLFLRLEPKERSVTSENRGVSA
jgi:hypothetical protein